MLLYPKNNDPELTADRFQTPENEYRAVPFWAWNDKLSQPELLRQMDVLRRMGFGGVQIHVRSGLRTRYMSREFLSAVDACVQKAERDGMMVWLYDEDRWPSGAAGGLATSEPRYRQKYLRITRIPYSEEPGGVMPPDAASDDPVRTGNGQLLGRYRVELNTDGTLKQYRMLDADEPDCAGQWYAYLETALGHPWFNGSAYLDTLSHKAVEHFISLTHETYAAHLSPHFGKSIPAVFTDEPQFARKQLLPYPGAETDVTLPWTEDLEQDFCAAYDGASLLAKLPELLWELSEGRVSQTRYRFHDFLTERFVSSFCDTAGRWCDEHQLLLTGHMMEEATLQSQCTVIGEAMRAYRSFSLPGVDILCGALELNTLKQCQSAVRQYGREGMLCEEYGVTGWFCEFRDYLYAGNWLAALGVTVRVPHMAWLSMRGEAKRDYPASFNEQSPWHVQYAAVENHFARLASALSRGNALTRIGVIHPMESYWLYWGPVSQTQAVRDEMDAHFADLTTWLLSGGLDFDFLCESLLPSLCPAGGAPLRAGACEYDVILVPDCRTLRKTTLDRLEAFRQAGGTLIFLGKAPTYEDALPSARGETLCRASVQIPFSRAAVLCALAPWREVTFSRDDGSMEDNLLYQLRADGTSRWLFLAERDAPKCRDVPECRKTKITLRGAWRPILFDADSGQTRALPFIRGNGQTELNIQRWDYQAVLLKLLPDDGGEIPQETQETMRRIPVLVPELVSFEPEEPNVLVLDRAEYALDEETWHEPTEILRADNACRSKLGWPLRGQDSVQPWSMATESISNHLHLRFRIQSAVLLSGVLLAMEEPETAEIHLNGIPVEKAATGWYADRSIRTLPLPPLAAGENVLELTLPFGKTTETEWCYLLGRFGVTVNGTLCTLTALPQRLSYDDITRQGMAHYSGNLNYTIPVCCAGGTLCIHAPHFRAAYLQISVDGSTPQLLMIPPYTARFDGISAGSHTVTICACIPRENTFRPFHNADTVTRKQAPESWRTSGDAWTQSYRLSPEGLLSAPEIWMEEI